MRVDMQVEKVIKKYSNFVSFPVVLDGDRVNTIQALWRASSALSYCFQVMLRLRQGMRLLRGERRRGLTTFCASMQGPAAQGGDG